MVVFSAPAYAEHDSVQFCRDRRAGLYAIIAIHDTTLGPACGGCRMWPYESEEDAIRDVLRLSRGMSYKNAMADLAFGGGKSVIIGDPKHDKTESLLRAFGRFINALGGRYITAEDVGVSVSDMEIVAQETQWACGLEHGGAASGDPSPMTAFGVFVGIKAAVRHKLHRDDLNGLRVAVQGVGHVGYHLCRLLHEAGARLIVTDIDTAALARVQGEFGAEVVALDAICAADVDVFAPCALGGVINDDSLAVLNAKIVAGSANNQLAEPRHDAELKRRGILYAPDYVINAGGIINCTGEIQGHYSRDEAQRKTAAIYDTLAEVFHAAGAEDRPTGEVADDIARRRIEDARARKLKQKVA